MRHLTSSSRMSRTLFRTLSHVDSRVIRTMSHALFRVLFRACRHTLSARVACADHARCHESSRCHRVVPHVALTVVALSARDIKPIVYHHLCQLISYLFNHPQLK
jgi:hypothetical protein